MILLTAAESSPSHSMLMTAMLAAWGPDLKELVQTVNEELIHANNWIVDNNLSANNTKLLHLLYTHEKNIEDYVIKLGDFAVPRERFTKLLGLYIDDKLKWTNHTKTIACKLSKLSGILYLCRKKISNECLKTIYYSLAYSHMSYGITLWGGTWASHLNSVLVAQKRVLRVITFASRYDRSLPLFIQNRILSFNYVFMYFSSLLMFKFLHLNYCQDLFKRSLNLHNTRNNVNSLYIPFYRTVRSQKSVFYCAPKIWNSLPNELKIINNIITFKSKLRRYLHDKQSSDQH